MSADAGAGSPAHGDFRRSDLALAIGLALLIELGAGLAIRRSGLEHQAKAPEIERGLAKPVRVIPVVDLDAPLLKLGGGKAKLPDRWMKPRAKARAEERAFVSTKAEKTVEAIPREDLPLADAGTPLPPPDAELTKQVDSPSLCSPTSLRGAYPVPVMWTGSPRGRRRIRSRPEPSTSTAPASLPGSRAASACQARACPSRSLLACGCGPA